MQNYNLLTEQDKIDTIKELYENQKKSFKDIAKELNTYANKIRRDAIKHKINIRDKSDAQKNALNTGKHNHPTKGKKRSQDTKHKIGNGVLKSWEKLSTDELNSRKQKAKENWQNLTEDEKQLMQQKANQAVRDASKTGSKLEKFLVEKLIEDGYKIQFHQEQTLVNTKLQIDIFLPAVNTAIEVDGPSHFSPIWGEDTLNKNVKYDQKKTGLILGKGLKLIRIKQTMDFSQSRSVYIYKQLKTLLLTLDQQTEKVFLIEDRIK
jgi:very-short-patch-repair endonuclease